MGGGFFVFFFLGGGGGGEGGMALHLFTSSCLLKNLLSMCNSFLFLSNELIKLPK